MKCPKCKGVYDIYASKEKNEKYYCPEDGTELNENDII